MNQHTAELQIGQSWSAVDLGADRPLRHLSLAHAGSKKRGCPLETGRRCERGDCRTMSHLQRRGDEAAREF